MALPLLLGLAGSGLGAAGLAGGLGALTAGAIGSGLGSYLETGDLGQGLQTGILSYFGGKATGALAKNLFPSATPALSPGEGALMDSKALAEKGLSSTLGGAAPTPQPSLFSLGDPTKGLTGMKAFTNPATLGGIGASDLSLAPQGDFGPRRTKRDISGITGADYGFQRAPEDYRPGIDDEFKYFTRMQTGGITEANQEGQEEGQGIRPLAVNDKEIINLAVDVIKGEIDEERGSVILAMFQQQYGREALADLIEKVQSGEFDANAAQDEGLLKGAGDGMDDVIPAKLEGKEDYALSDGEYIVAADVVSGIGNGSTNAGAKRLDKMQDTVRKLRTGKEEQAPDVDAVKMLPEVPGMEEGLASLAA
tara:strand:- start:121 stop:1215 length:1095 start_codon:yes stop_codon:yes gene_type:complete